MKASLVTRKSKVIGTGTFGKVYIVNHEGQETAIKQILVTGKTSFCASLLEIDVAKKLKHPNIITLFSVCSNEYAGKDWDSDYGFAGRCDDYCLSLDPVKEGDVYTLITNLLDKKTYLDIGQIKFIFTQILLGIWYMHRNNYIHRDIKPTNILVREGNIVKICDFGFAKKFLAHDVTTCAAGSKYFRAPEILLGLEYNLSSDVWSLGCVLHYIMTGGRYFVEDVFFKDLDRMDKFVNEDTDAELRYIVGSMPYPITANMFNVDDPIIDLMVRDEEILTEKDFFDQHRFKMSQDDVLLYRTILFSQMLQINPEKRSTVDRFMYSKFLLSDDASRKLIENEKNMVKEMQSKRIREIDENKIASSLSTEAYKNMTKIAIKIFVNYRNELWYTDKILFTAIDVFSRSTANDSTLLKPTAAPETVEKFFSSCLYISIKYHAHIGDDNVPAYNELPFVTFKALSDLRQAKSREDNILSALDFATYNTTVLDILLMRKTPEMIEIVSLFLYITSGLNVDTQGNTLTPTMSYERWKNNKQNYLEQTEKHQLWETLKKSCWSK